jgi:hypothetical protein
LQIKYILKLQAVVFVAFKDFAVVQDAAIDKYVISQWQSKDAEDGRIRKEEL